MGIDDGWHGQNPVFTVVDNRIRRSIFDDVQISAQMSILLFISALPIKSLFLDKLNGSQTHLVDGHQLFSRALNILVQRRKLDLLRVFAHVPERSLNRIEVVRSNGDESTLTTQILVKLVLQVDERFIFEVVEWPAQAENARGKVRSERGSLKSARSCRWRWDARTTVANLAA